MYNAYKKLLYIKELATQENFSYLSTIFDCITPNTQIVNSIKFTPNLSYFHANEESLRVYIELDSFVSNKSFSNFIHYITNTICSHHTQYIIKSLVNNMYHGCFLETTRWHDSLIIGTELKNQQSQFRLYFPIVNTGLTTWQKLQDIMIKDCYIDLSIHDQDFVSTRQKYGEMPVMIAIVLEKSKIVGFRIYTMQSDNELIFCSLNKNTYVAKSFFCNIFLNYKNFFNDIYFCHSYDFDLSSNCSRSKIEFYFNDAYQQDRILEWLLQSKYINYINIKQNIQTISNVLNKSLKIRNIAFGLNKGLTYESAIYLV